MFFEQGLTILASLVWYFCNPSETLVPVPTNQAERSGSLFPEWSDSVYWFDSFFASPAFVLLPLLPITYPFIWLLLSAVGEAKTLHSGIAKRISVQFRAVSLRCEFEQRRDTCYAANVRRLVSRVKPSRFF